jgi:hypothetical protein
MEKRGPEGSRKIESKQSENVSKTMCDQKGEEEETQKNGHHRDNPPIEPQYPKGQEVKVIEGVGVEEGDVFEVRGHVWDRTKKKWLYTLDGWMGMVEEDNMRSAE